MRIFAKALIGAAGLGLLVTPMAGAATGDFHYDSGLLHNPAPITCHALFSPGPPPSVHRIVNATNSGAIAFTGANCTGQALSVAAGTTLMTPTALASVRFNR